MGNAWSFSCGARAPAQLYPRGDEMAISDDDDQEEEDEESSIVKDEDSNSSFAPVPLPRTEVIGKYPVVSSSPTVLDHVEVPRLYNPANYAVGLPSNSSSSDIEQEQDNDEEEADTLNGKRQHPDDDENIEDQRDNQKQSKMMIDPDDPSSGVLRVSTRIAFLCTASLPLFVIFCLGDESEEVGRGEEEEQQQQQDDESRQKEIVSPSSNCVVIAYTTEQTHSKVEPRA